MLLFILTIEYHDYGFIRHYDALLYFLPREASTDVFSTSIAPERDLVNGQVDWAHLYITDAANRATAVPGRGIEESNTLEVVYAPLSSIIVGRTTPEPSAGQRAGTL